MEKMNPNQRVLSALDKGMQLAKCRQCGCMQDVLDSLSAHPFLQSEGQGHLHKSVEAWQKQMKPVKYT